MSGTPNKRGVHEEGGGGGGGGGPGHSSNSRYSLDDSAAFLNVGTKLTSSASNEYHTHLDIGQDARMPTKIPRLESRDADRRSSLLPMYRVTASPLNDSHSGHPAMLENRPDDNRDPKMENRDNKIESRDLYQGARSDKDVRFESRGDDNKETKYDKDPYSENKGEAKIEKDGYGVATSHLNWKESKEHHRPKRYPDIHGGNADPWHTSRSNLHGVVEVGKECSNTEERAYVEGHEAAGESKVDLKGEDKFKEKDRKRKDGKHREWGESNKERSDRRTNLQVGNSSGEGRELLREEREAERWEKERERKDISKDKEKARDKDKDHTKREAWNGVDKEGILDLSGRTMEQDNSTLEQKKQKEHESWKNVDKEARERRKERDADIEGERPEKRGRCYDKESDDGCVDADGVPDRDRELFNYGVQQRKRMLRPRGSPQLANREPRFRSHTQDNEGSQGEELLNKKFYACSSQQGVLPGKNEVSAVVYRVGECMQELMKLWKEYEASQGNKSGEISQNGPTIEIRIPAEHVTATNRQVRGGQLWGTDIYTDDSDLVAVLMHTGYCRPTASSPPSAIQELHATIRVLPPQDCYLSTLRNNVRSRAWGAAIGCSYRVEKCSIVKKGGGTIDLEPCLTHTSTVEPTLAPVAVERTMTTRAAASNALRQQRFVREVTIQYNLCNEPWIKYSISIVADKGLKKPLFTSARLKKGEVLYLETHSHRYELCFNGEKTIRNTASLTNDMNPEKSHTQNSHFTSGERSATDVDSITIDVFRWSCCKKPFPQKVLRSIGIPLPLEHIEVMEENLDWEDIQWSQTGVWIGGKEYHLARVHFLSPS